MLTIGFPCREYTTFERIIRISLTFNYKKEKRAYLSLTHPLSVGDYVLFVDGCNTRKYLAFDGFEQSAAAGRYIRYTAGQAELVDASYGVTATYQ